MILKILRTLLVAVLLSNILLNTTISSRVNAAGNTSVTKDLSIDLTVDAERFSDIQYLVENPNGVVEEYPLFTNDSDRNHTQTINLGTNWDEKEDCIEVENKRRVGICEDGIYKVYVQSTDAVGNKSDYSVMDIERDTVKPMKPEGEVYICGLNICLRIDNSEPNSFINNEVNDLGQVDAHGRNSFVVLRNFAEDATYNFGFVSKDRAQNESEKLELSIHTPSFGRGGGGESILGSVSDVYGGLSANDFNDSASINVYARPDGRLDIMSIDVIPPVITYIQNIESDGNIIIYGVGLTKGQKIKVDLNIEFKGYTLEDSLTLCDLTMAQYLLNPQNACVNSKLYSSYSNLPNTNCNIPEFRNCTNYFEYPIFGLIHNVSRNITLSQVEIDMFRDGNEYINPIREKIGYGVELEDRAYLNENPDGQFQFGYNKANLQPGQKLSASLKAYFGDIALDYNGYNFKTDGDINFAVSPKGNGYIVPEESSFFNDVVHPLAYDSGCGKVDKVWTGPNGDDDFGSRPRFGDFHWGVDLRSLNGGKDCLVNSIREGKVTFSGLDTNGANMVDVLHLGNYMTRYLHGDNRLVAQEDSVEKNTYLFKMGCTGRCTGRHLHFELFINGGRVDPQLEDYFGYMGGDGNFYNSTKQY